MLSKVLTYATFFAASALGVTAAAVNFGDVVTLARQRGIDVHGPIPADATPIAGGFSFKADSDAAYWVRAQATVENSGDLEKRTFSGMGIGFFTGFGCTGDGKFINDIQYDHQNVAPANFLYNSVSIGGRSISPQEQLDFSTRDDNDLCAFYQSSLRDTGIGCYEQSGFSCVRLIAL